MLKKTKNNILPIVFLLVILLGCFGTLITQGKQIAWNVIKNNEGYKTDDTVNGNLRSYVSAFESAVNDGVFLKEKYIDLFGALQNAMSKNVIPSSGYTGTIVRGSDNKLYSAASITTESEDGYSLDDIAEYSKALIQLNAVVKNNGAELLYVQAPQKYHEGVTVPIPIDAQRLISRKNEFLNQIDGKVDYIDIMQKINEENKDYDSMFFATDHHWTVDSAFWCYQEICEYLNENTEYHIDKKYFDADNWDIKVLKNAYLGSTGVRVGSYYVGRDDFSLITPKFDTDYERHYMSTRMVDYQGDFAHCVLTEYDKFLAGDYGDLAWGTYTGSDSPYVSIENHSSANYKKVLIVKDSFGLPVSAFMCTTCKNLVIYDPRYSHDKSLLRYIEDEKFDLVLFVYNPEALNSNFFSFV